MHNRIYIATFIATSGLLALNSNVHANPSALSQTEAELRSKQVSDVQYQIHLDLTQATYNPDEDLKPIPNLPSYSGKVTIHFSTDPKVATLSSKLFLDFNSNMGGTLHSIKINGQPAPKDWDKARSKILLPTSLLKTGSKNQIEIQFSNRFTRNGKGFHRAIDQEDHSVYIFTNLEPFYANEVFPLFDQPDLKATFQLTTEVPHEWHVISNNRETVKTPINPKTAQWAFPPTERISSYLFALVTGPFHIWEPETKKTPQSPNKEIPLRLLARKTQVKYVNAADWLKITREGFNYYEKHFGPYPFQKYDQIIVPEILSGAMENVGAVTFNENLISRGKMTPTERNRLAETIFHEMAHMWFGDLVTMKWWDDLWLNESFATFVSYLVIDATQSKLNLRSAWEDMFSGSKGTAYHEDHYQTTHPIVGTVTDTSVALSNFDGITYGKGSAVLKQLYFYVGEKNFFKGVRRYFEQHSFQNATRADFLSALSWASGLNLKSWDEQWLGTKGTNSVQLELTQSKGKIRKLVLRPFADPMENRFRTHRTRVGLYYPNKEGKIVIQHSIPVSYSSTPIEIPEAVGKKTPALVFANADDFDFANEILVGSNLELAQKNLGNVADPLLRLQLYYCLWLSVRDGLMPAREFIATLIRSANSEEYSMVLEVVLSHLKSALYYAPLSERLTLNNAIEDFLFKKLQLAPAGTDLQESLFVGLLQFVKTPARVSIVKNWLLEVEKVTGVTLDQDKRWKMLAALSRNQADGFQKLIETESARDPSNRGTLFARIAKISIPEKESKETWFNELTTPNKINPLDSARVGAAFHEVLSPDLTAFVQPRFLSGILRLIQAKEADRKVAALVRTLYPYSIQGTPESPADKPTEIKDSYGDEQTQKFLMEHREKLSPMVLRAFLNSMENNAARQKGWKLSLPKT